MRCAAPIATARMKRGEILARYNERKIEIKDEGGNKTSSVIILCPSCISVDITDGEILLAKEQIIGGFDSLLGMTGVKDNHINDSKRIFQEGTIKDLKSKNEIKVLPEA